MESDIEKKLYIAADSTKMREFGDRLDHILSDTGCSLGASEIRDLSDDKLEKVAGGIRSEDSKHSI